MGPLVLQSNRIEPTDTDTRRDHQIEAPLNLLARSIASSLKIDHCAIEYTIASGSQGWAGSERSDMINEAACRNGTPGTDDVSELSRDPHADHLEIGQLDRPSMDR